jgi:hypothetical protein
MIRGEFEQQSLYDFELAVRQSDGDYLGEIRTPSSTDQRRLPPIPEPLLNDSFREKMKPREYGNLLFDWLFQEGLLSSYQRAHEMVEADASAEGSVGVRFRLALDDNAPELARLPWEALWNPDKPQPVAVTSAFSRFIRVRQSRKWPIVEQPLDMHLIVSNPKGLSEMNLSEVDDSIVHDTVRHAMNSLGTFLRLTRMPEPPTLENIAEFSSREHHILHLLIHAVPQGLVLANNNGAATAVPFDAVVKAVTSSPVPPRLVFLGMQLETGTAAKEISRDFAPALVRDGVLAVAAVLEDMTARSLRVLSERFYDVLVRTGVVDVAMMEARKMVFEADQDGPHWSSPVLFSRTMDNRLFQPLSGPVIEKLQGITFK